MKVDLKAGHSFKTEQQEFEIGKLGIVLFDKNDSVIGILEVGDSGGVEVSANTFNMSRVSRGRENTGQRINNKIEKERGDWVALAESPPILKERAGDSINTNSSVSPLDKLHDAMNIGWVEAFCKKDTAKERPSDAIIGFLEI